MVTGQYAAPYMVDNLSSQRDYLLHEVGLSNCQVGIVLTKHPQLMTHCLDPIKSRIRFLESYNYSKGEICKMIQACPEILASSIDTMSAKLVVLGSIFGREAALSTFCKYPRIIMYNSSALQKSFDFLLDTVKLPVKEIQPLIVMRNVERIILPRFNHLRSLNVPDSYFRRRFWIQSSDAQFINQFPDYRPLPKSQRKPCVHPSSASKSVESGQFSTNTSSSLTTIN
uniref:AlNc14C9G1159 protein n=1 Tax=Albugo laibachii Nc14 TaxID=890382 RepID=F0W2A9_9STRA|nr:AlNc14C9G1159 [Albugo laibachii Nc14]|eukprot:CCA15194.1 AlNc14C9G1159 [Albugo laibachii Nc14]